MGMVDRARVARPWCHRILADHMLEMLHCITPSEWSRSLSWDQCDVAGTKLIDTVNQVLWCCNQQDFFITGSLQIVGLSDCCYLCSKSQKASLPHCPNFPAHLRVWCGHCGQTFFGPDRPTDCYLMKLPWASGTRHISERRLWTPYLCNHLMDSMLTYLIWKLGMSPFNWCIIGCSALRGYRLTD